MDTKQQPRDYWKGLKNKNGKPYGVHQKGSHHKGTMKKR
jgi:hypothetical protein